MRLVCFDCETKLIRPGLLAPPVVGFGWCIAEADRGAVTVLAKGGVTHLGETWGDALPGEQPGRVSLSGAFLALAAYTKAEPGRLMTNQNIPYDFACLMAQDSTLADAVFDLYDRELVEDTMLREQLLDNAKGYLGFRVVGKRVLGKEYTLAAMAKQYFDVDLDKTTWRTGYAKLWDVPLAHWPQGAKDYMVDDTTWAVRVWAAQEAASFEEGSQDGSLPTSAAQSRGHFGLHLCSTWGIRTDPQRTRQFDADLHIAHRRLEPKLRETAIVVQAGAKHCEHEWRPGKGRAQGFSTCACGAERQPLLKVKGLAAGTLSKNKKALKAALLRLCDKHGVPLPLTDTGKERLGQKLERGETWTREDSVAFLQTDADFIEEMATLDGGVACRTLEDALGMVATPAALSEVEALSVLGWYSRVEKLLSTYVPVLYRGNRVPINARYRSICETGRASCSQPNLMNLPKAKGVRQCYVARRGRVFCSVDYEALELHTLAQACLALVGHSALADALNAGLDPHLLLACEWLLEGVSYDEGKKARKDANHPRYADVEHARQLAKVANFGLPGGLGIETLVAYAKASGVVISREKAAALKNAWLEQWPEMREYFRIINGWMEEDADPRAEGGDEVCTVVVPVSGFVRGRARYTAACNTPFQSLAASGAKEAVYELAKHSYCSGGELLGSRLVVFVHDEVIMEHPSRDPDDLDRRARAQARIMVDAMARYLPDVKPKAEPALMKYWDKEAKTVYDDRGRVTVWQPKQ